VAIGITTARTRALGLVDGDRAADSPYRTAQRIKHPNLELQASGFRELVEGCSTYEPSELFSLRHIPSHFLASPECIWTAF